MAESIVIRGKDYELGIPLKKLVIKKLKSELCVVCFNKADKTIRVMLCTLLDTFLPPLESMGTPSAATATRKANNPYLVTVWDVEKQAWRSFNLETFTRLSVINPV